MTALRYIFNIIQKVIKISLTDSYQQRLEQYLSTKSITDAATLEIYIKEFSYNSHRKN